MHPVKLAEEIKRLAKDVGYVACGITSADPFIGYKSVIERRQAMFPDAAALYGSLKNRAYPGLKNPWAESIVVCVRWYGKYRIPEGISSGIGRTYLFDRRFRGCPDHDMPSRMKAGLQALGMRVRGGGVPERRAAARAGAARFGRNNFVYAGKFGSWINIESWLVDAKLPQDRPSCEPLCPDSCRACIDCCPTGALESPFCMRWDRCVAYLTYHAPEPIGGGLWHMMDGWVYGCDQCQLACPLNDGMWGGYETAEWLEEIAPHLSNEALANMDDETYRSVVQPAFWYVPPDGVMRWQRNARRALLCGES